MSEYGLGRKGKSPHDPRDFRMAAALPAPWYVRLVRWFLSLFSQTPDPPPPPPPPGDEPYIRHTVAQLDQEQTPHCVGFAGAHFEAADPIEDIVVNATGDANYYACKIIDGEPRAEDGTFVRSLAKVFRNQGHIGAYYFADSVDDILGWLRQYGPVVMGTDWYDDMFNPDVDGTVHIGGDLAGGHSYIVLGDYPVSRRVLCQNSWGSEWGVNGRFILSYDDLARLLAADGEALGALELPL